MSPALTSGLVALGREALRIVLPSWCIACGEELGWRDRKASVCSSCWAALPKITTARCTSCALPWSGAPTGSFVCVECLASPLPVEWCDAWGLYTGRLERVLHAFKFERHDFLAAPLALLVEERLRERGDVSFDMVVAVPMHRSKERRRGYNQAALVAEAVAHRIGVPFGRSLLRKDAERETQSTLSRPARAANVRGVFSVTSKIKESSILVVDDICTTGETFRACAEVLVRAGARRVCAIAIAKAPK